MTHKFPVLPVVELSQFIHQAHPTRVGASLYTPIGNGGKFQGFATFLRGRSEPICTLCYSPLTSHNCVCSSLSRSLAKLNSTVLMTGASENWQVHRVRWGSSGILGILRGSLRLQLYGWRGLSGATSGQSRTSCLMHNSNATQLFRTLVPSMLRPAVLALTSETKKSGGAISMDIIQRHIDLLALARSTAKL